MILIILKRIISSILIIINIFIITCSLIFILNLEKHEIDIRKLYQNESINIYDRYNNIIKNHSLYNRTNVSFNQINDNLINAVISIEDNEFYKHNGISFKGIGRAFLTNIKSKSFSEGASTITQQLIKNVYLNNNKNIKRKINEVSLAIKLEKILPKNEILTCYLNNILFGRRIYGIYEASKYYFNKKPIDLTINESAFLAGIIQRPNHFNPYNNYDEAMLRKNICLLKMYENNYISKEEYTLNISSNLEFSNNTLNNSYIDMYLNNIELTTDTVLGLDLNIQQEIYKIMRNDYNTFPNDEIKCAIALLDNKTMTVLGAGTNRTLNYGDFNYLLAPHQPGSTIKPLIDYAPAIEFLHLSPGSVINDEPYSYSTNEPLKNWDYKYKGYITLRKALSESRNIPALKLFQLVGEKRASAFINRLGLNQDKIYESEAIGGSSVGYSLLSLCDAYAAFANNGIYQKSSFILDNTNEKSKAMSVETAFLINNMLHDVFKNTSYDLKNTYLMAKTGQTNFDKKTREKYNISISAVKDSLIIAYTLDLTLGIWVSYDTNKKGLMNEEKFIPRVIMHQLLSKYAKDNRYPKVPDSITLLQVENDLDKLYLSNNGYYDYFIKKYMPLSYKNKNDVI